MTQTQYPICGYAPGGYQRKCHTCDQEFFGHKEAFQCEPCAIKDKEFYEALTPEQRERFDKRFAEIAKLFFEGIKKDEDIARLRKELEKIKQEAEAAIAGKLINTEQKSNMALYNIKWSATEALKQ